MKGLAGLMALLIAVAPAPLSAFPDGAPWGSADPNSSENCASCHFDGEAVYESDLISMTGWEPLVVPGDQFELVLLFQNKPYAHVGMQIVATAGSFEAKQDGLEVNGTEIRSSKIRGGVGGWNEWRFTWNAPDKLDDTIKFYIAINESNDDQSAFGDQIHFKKLEIYTSEEL